MPEFYIKDKKGRFYDLAYIEIEKPDVDALVYIKDNYPAIAEKYVRFFALLDTGTDHHDYNVPYKECLAFYYVNKLVKEKTVYDDPQNNFRNINNHYEFLKSWNNQKMWEDFRACADEDLYKKEQENKIKNKKLIVSRMRQLDSIISDNKIVKKIRTGECYFGPRSPHIKEITEYIDLVDQHKKVCTVSRNSQIYLLNFFPPDLTNFDKVSLFPNTSVDKYAAGVGYLIFLKNGPPSDSLCGFYAGGEFVLDYDSLAMGEISEAKIFSSQEDAILTARSLIKTPGLVNCQYYIFNTQIKIGDLIAASAAPSFEINEILNYQTSLVINKKIKKSAIKKKVINKL